MSHRDNLRRIEIVADTLGDLRDKVVFVGGATVSLYAHDVEPFDSRVTDDVDGIIQVANYSAHANFEEKLRQRGFANHVTSKVRCRYIIKNPIENIIVDIMPTEDINMGFKNRWYTDGFKNSIEYSISQNKPIRILAAPYFLATKLEAFKTRGRDDGYISKDFEDLVYVFENREILWDELYSADENVKLYLKEEFHRLREYKNFRYWIGYHAQFKSSPPTDWILDQLQKFVSSHFAN